MDDYEAITIIIAAIGLSTGSIAYVIRKLGCLPRLNTKINILYSLVKTHLKIDGNTNIDTTQFDKFFNEDDQN